MPNFKLYKRGAIWWYAGTINGKRFRKTTDTDDRALAAAIANQAEYKLRRAAVHGPEVALTFGDAVNLYLEAGKPGTHLTPLFERWESTSVKEITPGEVKKAAREIYPKAKPSTRNRQVLTPAKAVINHAAELGLCPPLKIKRFAEQKAVRRAVDRAYIDAFVEHAPANLGALMLFMYQTAARVSEAVALEWKSVDLQLGTATFGRTKNGHAHVAHLTVEMVAALANLPKDGRKVFGYASRSSVYEITKRICAKAGIPYLATHQPGRHSFATEMIVRQGFDPKTTGEIGNWKSVRVLLENYVHADDPKTIVERAFGTPLTQQGAKRQN